MKILEWKELEKRAWEDKNVALSIGVFDGFHLGHRTLIEKVISEKADIPLVVTFKENPKKVLLKDKYTGDLTTLDDKLRYLEGLGIDQVLIIDFSHEFSRMTGREFFSRLNGFFNISSLVVGYDFSFGKGALTKAKDLEELLKTQTSLSIMPPVYEGDLVISSTLIRNSVQDGRIKEAVKMLGHSYKVSLRAEAQPSYFKGTWTAARRDFFQILPFKGKEICKSSQGDLLEIQFEANLVQWSSPPENNFREFFF
ncbi:MAG: hypothetical protein A2Z96_00440 [Spirochaetes bacterium GWB1_48_6]|nr:MAG: hypothetical protein A2Z96_00440 [Spirochaetes bacterium GWB1_48_6]